MGQSKTDSLADQDGRMRAGGGGGVGGWGVGRCWKKGGGGNVE